MPRDGLTSRQVGHICRALIAYYPETRLSNKRNPLLEAIFILLSSQTNEENYFHTWKRFRAAYPKIEYAGRATKKEIYLQIRIGGLGAWKAARIKALLATLKARFGKYSLNSLSELDDEPLERELLMLDGIGIKSARCIMMYSFNRNVFPIDTHALRILRRIGFIIPPYSKRSRQFADHIQSQIPAKYRIPFHIKLVQHGRRICKTKPLCQECPIAKYCARHI